MQSIIYILKTSAKFLTNRLVKESYYTFGKGKRVRDLSEVKITLPAQPSSLVKPATEIDYVQLQSQLKQLNWQQIQFDRLCALPEITLAFISMQIKKNKFNVDDSQFYDYSMKELHVKLQSNANVLMKLNQYYCKIYHLIMNNLQQYDQLANPNYGKIYYQAQMYIMHLPSNTKLQNAIEYFVNNLNQPKRLAIVAEPSFVKCLLSIKRQLIMQGIRFQSINQQKIKRKFLKRKSRKQKVVINQQELQQLSQDESYQDLQNDEAFLQGSANNQQILSKKDEFIIQQLKLSKLKVKIAKVLGYEYEFWVDVKHNRSKNGVEDDYIIEQRQIDNPNQSLLVRQKYPKIKIRYIVHKKKRKVFSMHFCIKANLLINVSGSLRIIKVQWRGPSSNNKQNLEDTSFLIIDYEHIMNGNSTIKPVFNF